jgi:hypothetical protein
MNVETDQPIDIAGLASASGSGAGLWRSGRIPFLKIGRHVRFYLDDVEAWIGARRVEPHRPSSTCGSVLAARPSCASRAKGALMADIQKRASKTGTHNVATKTYDREVWC